MASASQEMKKIQAEANKEMVKGLSDTVNTTYRTLKDNSPVISGTLRDAWYRSININTLEGKIENKTDYVAKVNEDSKQGNARFIEKSVLDNVDMNEITLPLYERE